MDAITRSQSYGHGMMKHGYTSVPSHLVQNMDVPKSMQTTLSQPFLHDDEHGENHQLNHTHRQKGMSRTFSRPDILYQGSLHNIPHYRSHGDLSVGMDKYGSIRHVNESEVRSELIIIVRRCRYTKQYCYVSIMVFDNANILIQHVSISYNV